MSTGPRHNQAGSNQPKSLMRNLGEFFGHIVEGVKSTPGVKPLSAVVCT